MYILDQLRVSPESIIGRNIGFVVAYVKDLAPNAGMGGQCTINCDKLLIEKHGITVYELLLAKAGGDYFFPYVTKGTVGYLGQKGVGCVDVPKTVPNGTLVLTPGMNGCSLQVEDIGHNYRFKHYADEMAGKTERHTLCRIDYSDYDPDESLQRAMMPKGSTDSMRCPQFTLISIKTGENLWKIFSVGVVYYNKSIPYPEGKKENHLVYDIFSPFKKIKTFRKLKYD